MDPIPSFVSPNRAAAADWVRSVRFASGMAAKAGTGHSRFDNVSNLCALADVHIERSEQRAGTAVGPAWVNRGDEAGDTRARR
jgi:hypothetical protein